MDSEEAQLLYSRLVSIMKILNEVQKLELELEQCARDANHGKSTWNAETDPSEPTQNKIKPVERTIVSTKNRQTVDVFVHAEVLKMGEIDTKGQRFQCKLEIVSRWLAPDLNGTQNEWKDANKIDANDWHHWTPESFILNNSGTVNEKIHYKVMFDMAGSAMVEECRDVNGMFTETLELYDYPFDSQDLSVTLASSKSLMEVCYHPDPVLASSVKVSTFVQRQEWKLFEKIKLEVDTYRDANTRGKPVKSSISIRCKAKRHFVFFVWNVIAIMIVISGLSFSTFAIDFASASNRLPLTFLMMLSNTTFKFAVSKSLPKVCYLTYLDKYVLTSLTLMVLLCMWHAIVSALYKVNQNRKLTNRIDYGVMAIFCVAYVTFFAIFIAKTKYTVARAMKKKEKAEKLKAALEEKKQRP